MRADGVAEVGYPVQTFAFTGTQLVKHTIGAVMSDIRAATTSNALGEGSGRRQKNDDELCRTCRKLDLVKFFYEMNMKAMDFDDLVLIGTYCEIVSRSYCPFCRLVLSAVNNSLREPIGAGYRTEEGEEVCCVLRRRKPDRRDLWKRNLKIELGSIPTKRFFSETKINWRMINEDWKKTLQDCDAEIIVYNGCVASYQFPLVQPEADRMRIIHNTKKEEDVELDYRATHEAGWWLDPIPLLGCTPEPTFDVQKLYDWRRFCGRCNGQKLTSYNPKHLVAIPGMLLIDTTTFNLVPAPRGVAYVALSYVWGQLEDPFRTTKANREDLMATGDLSKAALPRTIMEYMEVVKAIGFHYFWVDSICIVQDHPEFLAGQIRVMDKIYESAALTLVAAGGESADNPLNTSRNQIRVETFGVLKLMARHRPFEAALR